MPPSPDAPEPATPPITAAGPRGPDPAPSVAAPPADPADVVSALAYALRFDGRRRPATSKAHGQATGAPRPVISAWAKRPKRVSMLRRWRAVLAEAWTSLSAWKRPRVQAAGRLGAERTMHASRRSS